MAGPTWDADAGVWVLDDEAAPPRHRRPPTRLVDPAGPGRDSGSAARPDPGRRRTTRAGRPASSGAGSRRADPPVIDRNDGDDRSRHRAPVTSAPGGSHPEPYRRARVPDGGVRPGARGPGRHGGSGDLAGDIVALGFGPGEHVPEHLGHRRWDDDRDPGGRPVHGGYGMHDGRTVRVERPVLADRPPHDEYTEYTDYTEYSEYTEYDGDTGYDEGPREEREPGRYRADPSPGGRRPARRWWPWLVGGVVAVAGIAAAVSVGVAVLGGGADDRPPSPQADTSAVGAPPDAPAAAPPPSGSAPAAAPGPAAAQVTFEVSGSGTASTLTYGRGTSVSQVLDAELPWTRTVDAAGEPAEYTISAAGGSGEIACRIIVDDAVVAEESADGDFAAVSCSGRR